MAIIFNAKIIVDETKKNVFFIAMKRLYVFWLLLFPLFCFAQERYTANWYKSDPAKYLNQIVTVYIQSCEPSSFEAVKGYVSYHCFTSYQGKPGGYIYMLVPSNKSRSFFRDYSDVRSKANPSEKSQRSAKAKFSKIKWENGLDEYVLILQ